ncbi:MAG: riboflavin biosynthesis protein [Phycisphaerae bacterium]
MRVVHGIEAARFERTVLTIGNFDGLHRGHQALVEQGRRKARASGGPLVVMTFEPHPASVLTPDRVPAELTPLAEKLRLLAEAGADAAVVVASKPEFFSISAEDFIREIIVQRFHPAVLVEGDSFRFGSHRAGDVHMLREAGSRLGFEVQVVEPARVALGGHPDTVISSSLVRHLLASGTVDGAALCLGRPYALLGQIRSGAGRGRELGFPTANLGVAGQLVPAEGVYAGRAFVLTADPLAAQRDSEIIAHPAGPSVPAAISIGRTPTFAGDQLLVEAHLLGFSEELYGRHMRLEFLEWLRHQQRFDSPDALKAQIADDVQRTRQANR